MREIEFREKSTITKKWIYGSLVLAGGNSYIVTKDEEVFDKAYTYAEAVCVEEVDPETVGQYVRSLINKQKLYEGDIISHPFKGIRTVIYDEIEGWFGVEGTWLCRMADGEIIGNKYDNPELMNEIDKE